MVSGYNDNDDWRHENCDVDSVEKSNRMGNTAN